MAREIPLIGSPLVAVVDDEDFEWLSSLRWYPNEGKRGAIYASRMVVTQNSDGTKRTWCREMQRDILDPDMKVPRSILSDHRDHDTLNNRRNNLRLVDHRTSVLNRRLFKTNTSGYRGVCFDKERGNYYTRVKSFGRNYLSKGHRTAEDAASAYNWFALIHHGEHAQLNLGPDGLPLPPRKHRFALEQMELSI